MNLLNTLLEYKKQGLVYSQTHPTLPLIIFNYTDKVQYEELWDDLLLRCRGLVLCMETGAVVNNPIPKFFNYSQPQGKAACDFSKPFTIYKKYDGSLILAFYYKDELVICSRGSFTSDQVKMAKDLHIENYEFLNNMTYCFELIHLENRIVCKYDKNELILLSVRDVEKGEVNLKYFSNISKLAETKELDISSYESLQYISENSIDNEEGYVIKFHNDLRCKVKFKEYFELHKLMTNLSTTAVWEALKDNIDITTLIEGVPDEFHNLVKDYEHKLNTDFFRLANKIQKVYLKHKDLITDKEFALAIQHNKYSSFMFMLRNQKDINQMIWKHIKPKYERL